MIMLATGHRRVLPADFSKVVELAPKAAICRLAHFARATLANPLLELREPFGLRYIARDQLATVTQLVARPAFPGAFPDEDGLPFVTARAPEITPRLVTGTWKQPNGQFDCSRLDRKMRSADRVGQSGRVVSKMVEKGLAEGPPDFVNEPANRLAVANGRLGYEKIELGIGLPVPRSFSLRRHVASQPRARGFFYRRKKPFPKSHIFGLSLACCSSENCGGVHGGEPSKN